MLRCTVCLPPPSHRLPSSASQTPSLTVLDLSAAFVTTDHPALKVCKTLSSPSFYHARLPASFPLGHSLILSTLPSSAVHFLVSFSYLSVTIIRTVPLPVMRMVMTKSIPFWLTSFLFPTVLRYLLICYGKPLIKGGHLITPHCYHLHHVLLAFIVCACGGGDRICPRSLW